LNVGDRALQAGASTRTERIPKNKRIIDYKGEKITHKESADREDRYLKKGQIWCFTLNTRWVIDAGVGGNIARFINHACKPNCYVEIAGTGNRGLRASRKIRTGEELTYDYNTDGVAGIPCRCSSRCRRMI
jgi:Proteins containing SET domain